MAYWPLWEPSGTVIVDLAHGRHGAYVSSPTLDNLAAPNGRTAPLFGVGYGNVQSTGLAAAYNGAEGSVSGYAKVSAGAWTDGTLRYLMLLQVNGNNRIFVRKSATNNLLEIGYVANGTGETESYFMNPAGWFHWGVTWSASNDRVAFYVNGARVSMSTGLGTWAGSLVFSTIGSAGGASLWDGWLSDVLISNRELTYAEIRACASAEQRPFVISMLGDSITTDATLVKTPMWLADLGYRGGWVGVIPHSVAGYTVVSNLGTLVTAAADDDADLILIHLGTNDNDAGDMGVLQATLEQGIDDLRASNPRAEIYVLGVLKRWTSTAGTTEIGKANIRAAELAACVAKDVIYWDTYNPSWIAASDTIDGTHPLEAAYQTLIDPKIYSRLP